MYIYVSAYVCVSKLLYGCRTVVVEMATVPGPLIWEIVKRNNAFLVKEFGNGSASVVFSKESNNLYNLNSYKHSGIHQLAFHFILLSHLFDVLA